MLGPQRFCVPWQPDSDHASQRRRSAFEHMVLAPRSPILRYHYHCEIDVYSYFQQVFVFLSRLYEETYRGHMVNIRCFRAFIFCVMLCVITLILQGNSCCCSDSHTDGIIGSIVFGLYPPSGLPVPPSFPPFWALPCLSLGVPGPWAFPGPFGPSWAFPGSSLGSPWALSLGEVRGVRFCGVRCEE